MYLRITLNACRGVFGNSISVLFVSLNPPKSKALKYSERAARMTLWPVEIEEGKKLKYFFVIFLDYILQCRQVDFEKFSSFRAVTKYFR